MPAVRRALAFVNFAAGEGLSFDDPQSGYKDDAAEIMCELGEALGIGPGEDWPEMLARFGLLP